jgi:hypothetical protein
MAAKQQTSIQDIPAGIDPREVALKERGWEKVHPDDSPNPNKLWTLPVTAKPTRELVGTRLIREIDGERGGRENVYQSVTPPAPWFYSLEEALQLQREREAKVLPITTGKHELIKQNQRAEQ